jgi:hypothetical protein
MATVTGPLHSDQARGQFAKQIIFQQRGGHSVAKRYAAPVEPNSDAQQQVKAWTKEIMQTWPTLTTEQQASWFLLALERNIEPINAFQQENYRRLEAGQDLTNVWPPDDETPPTVAIVLTNNDDENPASPDCTGDYEQIANINDQPAYRRISDQAWLLFYDSVGFLTYVISDNTDPGSRSATWAASDHPYAQYYPGDSYETGTVNAYPPS